MRVCGSIGLLPLLALLPAAAAWNSTVWPFCTGKVRQSRYSTVMPFSIIAAAVLSSIQRGSFTRRSAGRTRLSA